MAWTCCQSGIGHSPPRIAATPATDLRVALRALEPEDGKNRFELRALAFLGGRGGQTLGVLAGHG